MLTQLRLQNFRCFEDHTVPLRPCTIAVGRNNAGKSTLVDALRLVSIVSSRYQALAFRDPPRWGELPRRERGVSPSIKGMEFNTTNLFHRYGDPPAVITATFSNGAVTKIYVGPDGDLHAVVLNPDGTILRNKADAREGLLPRVEIMPQVAPLSRTENVLNADYVRSNLSSALAHQHFRNQLNILPEHLPALRALAEETWHGLQVRELQGAGSGQGQPLTLLVRNDDYVSEVATMGHGLQMWLQTMWFLSRVHRDATVILDEPDVYMHPDLQRRLVRHLKSTRQQMVVTTHSVEIMSEVSPEEILVIDRQHEQSQFAASFPAVQRILDHVGSAQNVQLARLWHARKSILIEGKDFRLLCDAFDILFPNDKDGLASLPSMPIGGWGGWQYAVGSSMLLQNSGGQNIAVYCVLDSDYHTEAQKNSRREQASRNSVQLHIWRRKEIENYLLVPPAIQRLIESRIARRTPAPTIPEVERQLETIFATLKDEVFDGVSAELLADDRGLGAGGANKRARAIVDSAWKTPEARASIVSGKSVLAQLSKWAQDQFGVAMTPSAIVRAMKSHEVIPEMRRVVTAIANGTPFPAST
jgi:energy-coupling factor transporter ATP-binding protein EcfA2